MTDETEVRDSDREFDLQPHPRILPMLGEINLEPWQCLAELIDNSLDAFISTRGEGASDESREVVVSLPTKAGSGARISVRDNGPGMDADTLENAVKAGWTGNDPISNLGMFGMGFNIATARLGRVTTVWSAREDDTDWHGLEIDFDKLMQQRHFRTPVLTRPKVDPHERGTEVTIERLKPEQIEWLSKPANRSKVNKRLEQVYASMLRPGGVPITVALQVNTRRLEGYRHCVWADAGSPERTVDHGRFGRIEAFQHVERPLSDRPFCMTCWTWLATGEDACPSCNTADNVVVRERRVYGWLGVQRFLDGNEYGIDFLRHGRKIEVANHDLFYWQDGTARELEYPIDDPRHRGRLVGEIHLDHCRVTYTKDRFDRNDPAWQEMLRIVRGEGPLRPDKAAELGYGDNRAPLFLLFQAFRRSTPKPKVAGCYARHLVVPDNDRAREMAQRFHAGEPEYQTDEKWWELVEEADQALLREDDAGKGPDADEFWGELTEEADAAEEEAEEEAPPPRRDPIASLTEQGRFLEYAPRRTILRFFEEHPELFFDGRYWEVEYDGLDFGRPSVTDDAKSEIARRYAALLWDVIWLADNDPEDLSEAGRSRLLRASLALDLLTSEVGDDADA